MLTERAALVAAVRDAIGSIDLRARVRDALTQAPPFARKPVLLAMGKSAATMLAGALDAYGSDGFSRVIVAHPRSAAAPDGVTAGEVFACGHPLPDEASVAAGRAMLSAVQGLGADDTVIVLLSGGASAAVCAPKPDFTLQTVRARCEALLSSGVDIAALNAARGSMDAVKLGGLGRAAHPAAVWTLASADILGDDAAVWASLGGAPTFEAHGAMRGIVLARPRDLRDAVIAVLQASGLAVRAEADATASVEALAERYAASVERMAPGTAWVAVGEPTVALPAARGRGGRAGRLALGVARALAGRGGWRFLACASDGVDGSSGAAGAAVSGETWPREGALNAWNTYADAEFLRSTGASLDTGPTGLNLLDVHAMVRG